MKISELPEVSKTNFRSEMSEYLNEKLNKYKNGFKLSLFVIVLTVLSFINFSGLTSTLIISGVLLVSVFFAVKYYVLSHAAFNMKKSFGDFYVEEGFHE